MSEEVIPTCALSLLSLLSIRVLSYSSCLPSISLPPSFIPPLYPSTSMKASLLRLVAAVLATATLSAATIDNSDEASELMGMASSMSGSYYLTSVGTGKSITEVSVLLVGCVLFGLLRSCPHGGHRPGRWEAEAAPGPRTFDLSPNRSASADLLARFALRYARFICRTPPTRSASPRRPRPP